MGILLASKSQWHRVVNRVYNMWMTTREKYFLLILDDVLRMILVLRRENKWARPLCMNVEGPLLPRMKIRNR